MSGPVDRYTFSIEARIHEDDDGHGFVHYHDHATVVRDNDGLRAELNFARDDIRELAVENERLRALLDESQRDAARYKWLRDVWWLGDEYFDTPEPMTCTQTADEFDAAIDEARIPRAGG